MSEKNRVYTISNFPIRLGELFKNIKKYDPAFVVDTFVSNKIHFHKNLRINALKEALRKPTDKIYYERKTLADEITYHLRFFDLYSEFCLQNYLYLLTDEEKVDYMLLLLANMLDTLSYKQISLDFLKVFLNEPAKNTKYDFYNLENELNKIFVDKYENVELDGLKIDLLRKVLYNSLSSADIYKFGLKYGVTIPKRLKKNELIGYVLQRLNLASEQENTYTREKLEKMPPILIERFAKDNNISIGSDLKKEDMIEYVLANHGSVKLYYRRPETIDAYSFTEEEKKQFNLIAEKVVEQPKPTVEVLVNKPVVASKQPIKEKEVVVVEGPTKVIIKENIVREINNNYDQRIRTRNIYKEIIREIRVPEVSAKELEEVNNSLDELEALIILNSHKKVDVQVPQNVQETVVQVAPEEVKVVKEKEEKPDRMPLFLRILLWTLASIVFLIIFLAIVLSVYVIVTQFVTNNFTDSIDTFVNKLTFGDKGLIDILRDAFARIGIYKAN